MFIIINVVIIIGILFIMITYYCYNFLFTLIVVIIVMTVAIIFHVKSITSLRTSIAFVILMRHVSILKTLTKQEDNTAQH